MNRVLHPVLHLREESEIELFLDSSKEYVESTEFVRNSQISLGETYNNLGKHTRVIAFFNDRKEYKNEYKLFQLAAEKLAKRDDLRMAFVTDSNLIQKCKEKYGAKLFDEFSLNSIVLEREKDQFIYYDVEKESMDIAYWINKMSLNKEGELYNRESEVIGKLVNQPFGILYIDRKDPKW